MKECKYKATGLIQETFDAKDVVYTIENHRDTEMVCASFPVDEGPFVTVRFVSNDDDNDVEVRILGLINAIPEARRARVLEACNLLNAKVRYAKFCLDKRGTVNVEYDLPLHASDDCVGEMAFEFFRCVMAMLDGEYTLFMKALYTDEDLRAASEGEGSRIDALRERLERMMRERAERAGDDAGDDAADEPDEETPADRRSRLARILESLRAGDDAEDEPDEADEGEQAPQDGDGPEGFKSFADFLRMKVAQRTGGEPDGEPEAAEDPV